MTPDKVPLPEASNVFAISNTPYFLLRKLQEISEAEVIAKEFSSAEILAALRRSVQSAPSTLEEAVRPYVLLVALADDIDVLRQTMAIEPKYADDWFNVARSALIQTYRSTSRETIRVPHTLPNEVRTTTSASTNVFTLVETD